MVKCPRCNKRVPNKLLWPHALFHAKTEMDKKQFAQFRKSVADFVNLPAKSFREILRGV